MVSTAERLLGPYRWTRFDLAVLPASFPYGGMETPGAVLLNPALVVGDRSQVDVVAHELAHFWHGDLVGCAEWSSFWLNEVRPLTVKPPRRRAALTTLLPPSSSLALPSSLAGLDRLLRGPHRSVAPRRPDARL